MTEQTIVCCLWFDGQAEEAANFYASVSPESGVGHITHAPTDYPAGKAESVLMVEFTLMGRPFVGLNGGPNFSFNESISFQIPVINQAEADRYYERLSSVPEAEMCGWVKDRYGVSWQIVPDQLIASIKSQDRAKASRVFEAMMQMRRLDLAKLNDAARG